MAQSLQQPDSGRSRGGPRWPAPPPLFLYQTGAQRAKKNWGGDHPPSPSYLKVWIWHCLIEHHKLTSPLKLTR